MSKVVVYAWPMGHQRVNNRSTYLAISTFNKLPVIHELERNALFPGIFSQKSPSFKLYMGCFHFISFHFVTWCEHEVEGTSTFSKKVSEKSPSSSSCLRDFPWFSFYFFQVCLILSIGHYFRDMEKMSYFLGIVSRINPCPKLSYSFQETGRLGTPRLLVINLAATGPRPRVAFASTECSAEAVRKN